MLTLVQLERLPDLLRARVHIPCVSLLHVGGGSCGRSWPSPALSTLTCSPPTTLFTATCPGLGEGVVCGHLPFSSYRPKTLRIVSVVSHQ